jgi:hypothetical protein
MSCAEASPRPAIIFFAALLVLVPTVLFIFKMGPVRAGAQWREVRSTVEADITDIINRYLEKAATDDGLSLEKARESRLRTERYRGNQQRL